MYERAEKGSGFPGQQQMRLPAPTLAALLKGKPLLKGLLAAGAGFYPKAAGHLRRRPQGSDEAILIYCARGGGWCELAGHLHTVRPGELVVVPPGAPHSYGAHASNPWTIHWVHAAGAHVREYLRELGITLQSPKVWVGEDLQVALLFNEVVKGLERGPAYPNVLLASQALAHLLALLIHRRGRGDPGASDTVQKVAQAIVYMSEHLEQPLRIGELAALAHLSPAHFTVRFKEQTGCSPRDYLHLLRMHQACRQLQDTLLSVKEIAARLGYRDPFHFSRQFKAFQGVSPRAYRAAPGAGTALSSR